MKIKQIIILLFILLSVIPLTVFGIGNMAYYDHKLMNVLENDLNVTVSTQMKGIENFFAERRTDAAVITGYRQVQELFQAAAEDDAARMQPLEDELGGLLKTRVENSEFVESITLLDSDFVVLSCSNMAARGNVSVLQNIDSKYLSRELQFTDVVESGGNGADKKVIAAIQEVYNDSRLAGYLVLEINLAFFEEERTSAPLLNNGTIYLIDSSNQLVTAGDSHDSRYEYQLSQEEREDYTKAWKNRDEKSRQGILRYKARGERYLSCYSYLDSVEWKIISSINMDEILQTKREMAELFLIVLAVLLFLLLVIRCTISRYIACPVNSMIKKFNQIRETKDYSIRMEPMRNYELELVATEVNSLLSNIEAYIEQEKGEQEKLKEKAKRDALTGLYNKAAMENLLREALEKKRGRGGTIACLFLDIDDFKNFNTKYRHSGGDKVLKFVAESLEKFFPGACGRQGGDEFLAFTDGVSFEELKGKASRLLKEVNRGIALGSGEPKVPVKCSIGAVADEDEDISYEELIGEADEVMYQIKHSGKNNCLVLSSREVREILGEAERLPPECQ